MHLTNGQSMSAYQPPYTITPEILIMARWQPLFAGILVASLIFEHQAEYYQALQESIQHSDSAPCIAFMLRMILAAMATSAPQISTPSTPPKSKNCCRQSRAR